MDMELCHGPALPRVSGKPSVQVTNGACECGEVLVVASPFSAAGTPSAGYPWASSKVHDRALHKGRRWHQTCPTSAMTSSAACSLTTPNGHNLMVC